MLRMNILGYTMAMAITLSICCCSNNVIIDSSNNKTPEIIAKKYIKGKVINRIKLSGYSKQSSILLINDKVVITQDFTDQKAIYNYSLGYIPQFYSVSRRYYKNMEYHNILDFVFVHNQQNSQIMEYYILNYTNDYTPNFKFSMKKIGECVVDCKKIIRVYKYGYKVLFQSKNLDTIYIYDFKTNSMEHDLLQTKRLFFTDYDYYSFDGRYLSEFDINDNFELFYKNKYDFFYQYSLNEQSNFSAPVFRSPRFKFPVVNIGGYIISPGLGTGIKLHYEGDYLQVAANMFLFTTKGMYYIDYDNNKLVLMNNNKSSALGSFENIVYVVTKINNINYLKAYWVNDNKITEYDIRINNVSDDVTVFVDEYSEIYIYNNDGIYNLSSIP